MSELVTKAERERWDAARERLRTVLEELADKIKRGRFEHGATARSLELKWQAISDLRYGLIMHDHERTDAILAVDWERFALGEHPSAAGRATGSAGTQTCQAVSDCLLRTIMKPRHA